MSEAKRVEVTNKATGVWTIGWLFTLGYCVLPAFPETVMFWETIGTLIFTYILWPLLLGAHLSGVGVF